jgi:hypothetical protein
LAADSVLPQLMSVFSLLGLAPPEGLASAGLAQAWNWAIGHWDVKNVPKRLNARITG